MKYTNIHIIRVPEETRGGWRLFEEIMAKHLNFDEINKPTTVRSLMDSKKDKLKKTQPRHISKLSKDKERVLKAAREK